ncbi:MAG: CBS domain-containing protein, partial [Calditrichia bacterium]
MIVLKWMTKEVITVGPDTPIHQIYNIFQKNDIHRVPVMSGEKLVGIVSDRDVRTALPLFSDKVLPENISEALERKKASDVMTHEVITIGPLDTIEKAALLMLNNKFGALPVLNNGQLSGIITEHDIFEALLEVTGAKWGVPRLSMVIDDRPGSVKEVADIIRNYPA